LAWRFSLMVVCFVLMQPTATIAATTQHNLAKSIFTA